MSTALSHASAEPTSLLNVIERASRDATVDVSKLQALLDMQERVVRAQAKQEFTQALSAVAGELEPVARDAKNSHTNTRYAKLEAIDAALRPIYSRHGFSVRFGAEPAAVGLVHVTCTLSHVGGHSETLGLAAPVDATGTGGKTSKTGVQAIGSTVTYLRRYLLTMALNVTFMDDTDDDGEASRRTSGQQRETPPVTNPGVVWKDRVLEELAQAQTETTVDTIRTKIAKNYAVCRNAQPALAAEIDTAERNARMRILAVKPTDDWDTTPGDDPIAELIAEVEAMDAEALDGLPSNAAWKVKVRDLFPLDADRLEDAIATRKAALRR